MSESEAKSSRHDCARSLASIVLVLQKAQCHHLIRPVLAKILFTLLKSMVLEFTPQKHL